MFISGNALIGSMLFMGVNVYFFNFKSKFLKIMDLVLEFFLLL